MSSPEALSVAGVERTVTHLKWPKDGSYAVVSITAAVGRCLVHMLSIQGSFLLSECIFGDE
jgi:hypothetical protein